MFENYYLFGENFMIGPYVFDAYLNMVQESSLTITQHPVQTGASISDHAFLNPKEFEFYIGMTDTTVGKIPGQFGVKDRSVNAYNTLLSMQYKREIYTLKSKYGKYNVLVESITSEDNNKTVYGGRFRVRLKEIITVNVEKVTNTEANSILSDNNRGAQDSVPLNDEVPQSGLRSLEGYITS